MKVSFAPLSSRNDPGRMVTMTQPLGKHWTDGGFRAISFGFGRHKVGKVIIFQRQRKRYFNSWWWNCEKLPTYFDYSSSKWRWSQSESEWEEVHEKPFDRKFRKLYQISLNISYISPLSQPSTFRIDEYQFTQISNGFILLIELPLARANRSEPFLGWIFSQIFSLGSNAERLTWLVQLFDVWQIFSDLTHKSRSTNERINLHQFYGKKLFVSTENCIVFVFGFS